MAELAIGQLIKIILGVLVVVVVITAVAFFFKDHIIGFFENMVGGSETLFLGLIA